MTLWLSILLQSTLLLSGLLLLAWWFNRRLQQQRHAFQELAQRLQQALSQQQHSQHEVEELRAGIIGVGQRVLQLDSALQQLSHECSEQLATLQQQQQAMALTDPESKMYSRAMKMVQLGADLDEIIRECELPRAEAELLYSLHQAKQ